MIAMLANRALALVLLAGLSLLVGAGLWLVLATRPASGEDAARAICGAATNGNTVNAAFQVQSGREFWDYFPYAGKAPELESDNRPMYLVVFDGPYVGPTITHQVRENVVCVVNADGDRTIYFDISREGYTRP
jgi:hypothetical protein